MIPHAHKRQHIRVLIALLFLCLSANAQAYAQRRGGKSARAKSPSRNATPAVAEDSRVSRLLDEGYAYAEGGKWDEAIRSYTQAIALDPRNAEAHISMGDAYMRSGKYKEGFAAYQQAIRIAPWNADAHYSLGAAYNDMAQYGDAFKPFVEAIRLDPNYAEAYFGIGFAYQWLQNYKDALGYLKQAVRLKPDMAEAHLSLGLTYLGLRDTKAAEEQFRILEGMDASLAKQLRKEMLQESNNNAATVNAPTIQPRPGRDERIQSPVATHKQETTDIARKQISAPQQTNESKRPPVVAATPKRTAKPAADASLLAVEMSFWDSIKNSNDAAEFAAYLRKYPEGQFADLALIRLRALEGRKNASASEVVQSQETAKEQSTPAQETPVPTQETPTVSEPQSQPTPVQSQPAQPQPVQEQAQPAQVQAQPAQELAKANVAAAIVKAEPVAADPPTATLKETMEWIRNNFSNRFTYQSMMPSEDSSGSPVTGNVNVVYEPIKFDGCRIDWRDLDDTLSVSLAELDPDSVKVELRNRPNTTFSMEVWNLSINATGGAGAIREIKGDGSGAINAYSGLDLQFNDKPRAERMARALQSAIKFCSDKSK